MLLSISTSWWEVAKGARFVLSPILNTLTNVFIEVLGVHWLRLHLLLVLLVQRLTINFMALWILALERVSLSRRWNLLVENSRENILVLLLLWNCLWDIGAQVVLLVDKTRVFLVFR
jgi:hypothetical protein